MSTATSFPPTMVQLPTSSEHLSVHTIVDSMHSLPSLPSAESIDEVQIGLEVQADEQSIDEDRVQSAQFDADPTATFQIATDTHASSEFLDHQVHPELVLEALDEAYQQALASASGSIADSIHDPPQAPTTADTSAPNSLPTPVSEHTPDHLAESTVDQEFISHQGSEDIESNGGFNFTPSLDERDVSIAVQNLAREVEADMETDPSEYQSGEAENENKMNYLVSQPDVPPESVAVISPLVAEVNLSGPQPLRRMDGETIPVTAHSKDSIIGTLDEAPTATTHDNVQFDATEGHTTPEGQPFAPGVVATQVGESQQDTDPARGLKEQTSTSILAQLEHIQVFGSEKGSESGTNDEGVSMAVGQAESSDQISGSYAPGAEGISASTTEGEIAAPVELNLSAPRNPTPAPANSTQPQTTSTAERVITSVEQTTTTIKLAEQPKSNIQNALEPPDLAIERTVASITMIATSADIKPSTLGTGAGETDKAELIQNAEQIEQEDQASSETWTGENQKEPAAGVSTVKGTEAPNAISTPDGTAPKDSGDPSHIPPEPVQFDPKTNPNLEAVGSTEPIATQSKNATVATENSHLHEPQYQITTSASSTAGIFDQPTPEWEGFAALDEDAPGSPEVIDSEAPEYPNLTIDHSVANPGDASTTDVAGENSAADADHPPEVSTPRAQSPVQRIRKQKMIMEVVIPISNNKSASAKRDPLKAATRGRPRSKPQAKASSSGGPSSSKAAMSSSPRPRSTSPASASTTPSPSKAQGPSTTALKKRTSGTRAKPFGSRKRTPKKPGKKPGKYAPAVHTARSVKVEVVMPRKPRPSALRRVGSMGSGNNVKFAPSSPVTGKRKAEPEPEETGAEETEQGEQAEEDDLDADAEGEIEEGYEVVEEVKVEEPEPRQRKSVSPKKRPRRSMEARRVPVKTPELVNTGRPVPKRRRLRR